MSWSRHCDAVNTGPAKEFWAFSRAQAKKRQQLGKIIPGSRLPVSVRRESVFLSDPVYVMRGIVMTFVSCTVL